MPFSVASPFGPLLVWLRVSIARSCSRIPGAKAPCVSLAHDSRTCKGPETPYLAMGPKPGYPPVNIPIPTKIDLCTYQNGIPNRSGPPPFTNQAPIPPRFFARRHFGAGCFGEDAVAVSVLVATSVLAEGIDVPSCGLVLCSSAANRSGRTTRSPSNWCPGLPIFWVEGSNRPKYIFPRSSPFCIFSFLGSHCFPLTRQKGLIFCWGPNSSQE